MGIQTSFLMVLGKHTSGILNIKIFALFAVIIELIYLITHLNQNSIGKIRIDVVLNVSFERQNIIWPGLSEHRPIDVNKKISERC